MASPWEKIGSAFQTVGSKLGLPEFGISEQFGVTPFPFTPQVYAKAPGTEFGGVAGGGGGGGSWGGPSAPTAYRTPTPTPS